MNDHKEQGILVVGSVAYDTVTTHAGSRQDALGGSATYFAVSAGRFAPVSVVAVVGQDFDSGHVDLLRDHGVDTSGLKTVPGRTFRWSGEYSIEDVNSRKTLDTQLNVFADFRPELTADQKRMRYVFLANIDPELQASVLEQMERRPALVAVDTMNFWIDGKRDALAAVLGMVDVVLMDENEVRMFASPHVERVNVVRAARYILGLGPKLVIVKRGEHGVIQFAGDSVFSAPAYPLGTVVDPTGAGDSFAGGFMGYLASTDDLSSPAFRRASVLGSVMGSFAVESFSVERLCSLRPEDLKDRYREITDMSQFDGHDGLENLPWRKPKAALED